MLKDDIRELLNRNSRENMSDTPDFLLAEYLMECLTTWESIVTKRDAWYGFSTLTHTREKGAGNGNNI